MSWQIRVKTTTWSSASWTTIPSPNADIVPELVSTRKRQPLFDGSIARLQPNAKKSNYNETDISWDFVSASSVILSGSVSLSTILSGGYPVEFKTHDLNGSGDIEYWYGYISLSPKTYKLGFYPNRDTSRYETYYDVSCKFDLISISGTEQND